MIIKFNLRNRLFLMVLMLFFIGNNAFSQFEQKLTINASVAFIAPDIASTELIYSSGAGADGGIQFNVNRNFSLLANARFFYIFGNAENPNSFIENVGFGGGGKINFLPRSIINPYVFAEMNVNFL